MDKIHVLHENEAWLAPLRKALEDRGLPHQMWFLDEGQLNLEEAPPEGVFYSRMSASSHTRDHPHAVAYTGAVLAWLEAHGRRVINGTRALQLEVSKAAQTVALSAHGITTPRTVVTAGREHLLEAAGAFAPGPVILKPNRGGKGLGVRLFHTVEALRGHVRSGDYEPPLDGLTLLQEYIRPPDASIVRAEFIGGAFFYAVRVDTSRGFELCPADACTVGDAFCPVGEQPQTPFEIMTEFAHPLLEAYGTFLAANEVEIAGIEFVTDAQGRAYTYDINTNTNYNTEAEERSGRSGMARVAEFLGAELARL